MKFTDLTEDQQRTLIQEGVTGALMTGAFVAAVRNLRKGRIGHALFYAALWHGWAFNAEVNRNAKRHKEIHNCLHKVNGISPAATAPRLSDSAWMN